MKINFDLNNTRAFSSGHSRVLPAGAYLVKIVDEADDVQLNNGNGSALVFSYEVVSGDYSGEILRDWINIGHINRNAVDIAERRLKAIGNAVGLNFFNDTRELFGRPFLIYVSKTTYQGKERNGVEGYERGPREDEQPTQPVNVQQTSNNKPFWT